MRIAFVLMLRDLLNILIVGCRGNFGSSCKLSYIILLQTTQRRQIWRVNGTAIVLEIYPVVNWVSLLVSGWPLGHTIT
jgi:hypothetical protein